MKKYTRDSLKRPIRTLYKRKGKESGGNEWVCIHCDLTFDNPSLLNLHTLTHAAEDVGLEEIRRLAGEITDNGSAANGEVNTASDDTTGNVAVLNIHLCCLVVGACVGRVD